MGKVEHKLGMDHNKIYMCVSIVLCPYNVQFLLKICKIWSKKLIEADS